MDALPVPVSLRKEPDPLKRNAGVVSIYDNVFTEAQFPLYKDVVKTESTAGKSAATEDKLKGVYLDWRTYQFSDHYPMWVRLRTDGSAPYLDRIARG